MFLFECKIPPPFLCLKTRSTSKPTISIQPSCFPHEPSTSTMSSSNSKPKSLPQLAIGLSAGTVILIAVHIGLFLKLGKQTTSKVTQPVMHQAEEAPNIIYTINIIIDGGNNFAEEAAYPIYAQGTINEVTENIYFTIENSDVTGPFGSGVYAAVNDAANRGNDDVTESIYTTIGADEEKEVYISYASVDGEVIDKCQRSSIAVEGHTDDVTQETVVYDQVD